MSLLAGRNIRLVTSPAHASVLLQPLDLVIDAAFTPEKGERHSG
jgi:hypothetical protein